MSNVKMSENIFQSALENDLDRKNWNRNFENVELTHNRNREEAH